MMMDDDGLRFYTWEHDGMSGWHVRRLLCAATQDGEVP
jgi:hypothetical protein